MNHEYLFLSDCHLHAERADVTAAFVNFIDQQDPPSRGLYILGDLFEAWLGDDDSAAAEPVIAALKRLTQRTKVYFIAGNRDFLLGDEFARQTGLILLDEPFRLVLGAQSVVLIHGDVLCTDDHDYQAFRAMVRSREWQSEFLQQPLVERQRIAAQLRSDSIAAMTHKTAQIMDVNAQAVQDFFHQQQVDTIIHGHTHRPAVHQYANGLTRYVLGDWNPEPSYLSWSRGNGFELVDARV